MRGENKETEVADAASRPAPNPAPMEKPFNGEDIARIYHDAKSASLGPTKDDAVRDAWDFVADVVNHRIAAARAAWQQEVAK